MTTNHKERVINLLMQHGYALDGETTPGQPFRIVTKASYPLPGAVITPKARIRLVLPNTNQKATVGKQWTCLYRVENGAATAFKNIPTSSFDEKHLISTEAAQEE